MTASGQPAAEDKKRSRGSSWFAYGALAAGIGLLFVCCGFSVSIISLILLPIGLGGLAVGFLAEDSRLALGPAPLMHTFAGLIVVGVMLLPLSLGGFLIRHLDRGDYLQFYGTHVTATVDPQKCEWINKGRFGNSNTLGCQGVTWTVDGRQQTGSMEIKGEDHPADPKAAPVQVSGWALDDAAVSDHGIRPGYQVGRVGIVPLWVGGAAIFLIAAGSIGLSVMSRRE